MISLLALLLVPVSAEAADDCLITVDKDIKDPAPAIYATCSVKGERLAVGKGLQVTAPDGSDGTNTWVGPFTDNREVFRSVTDIADSDATRVLEIGVGAAVDAKGNPRRRRGTCKFEDFSYKKLPSKKSCSLTLDGNAASTEVDVLVRLNGKGKPVIRVVLSGETFTADEDAVVDYAVTGGEETDRAEGTLGFIRSRAQSHLVFTDAEATLYSASSESEIWEGWTYTALGSDGKTSILSGSADIEPDILDGTIETQFILDDAAGVEIDVRGRADRDQDVAEVALTLCEGDCADPTVFDAELTTIQRHGVAVSGKGDPLGQSWTITSTGYDEDGKVVAGPFKVEVSGVEGADSDTRNITGGNLRKDGIAWRLGRGKKRVDWLEWDNSELVYRTRLPGHKWTHVVVQSGKSSLTIGGEQWRDQRLRGDLSSAASEASKALLETFSDAEFAGSIQAGVELTDADGKTVSKGKPGKTVVTKDKDDATWNVSVPYSW